MLFCIRYLPGKGKSHTFFCVNHVFHCFPNNNNNNNNNNHHNQNTIQYGSCLRVLVVNLPCILIFPSSTYQLFPPGFGERRIVPDSGTCTKDCEKQGFNFFSSSKKGFFVVVVGQLDFWWMDVDAFFWGGFKTICLFCMFFWF